MLKTPLPEIKKSSPFSAFFIFLYVFSFLISFICVSVTRPPPPPAQYICFLIVPPDPFCYKLFRL